MKNLILIIVLFLSINCSKDKESTNFTPQTITPVLLGKGELMIPFNNIITTQNIVLSSQNDWNNFITILGNSGNTSAILNQTTIDFNLFEVIAVFDSVKPTGGSNDITIITNVVENANNIVVTLQTPQSGDATIPTQPFHIVKIPVSTKPVVFQ